MNNLPRVEYRGPARRRRPRGPVRRGRPRGMVLFVVTIVVAMVTLSAYGFLVMTQTEDRAALQRADQLQSQQLAGSGIEYARAWAAASRAQRAFWGDARGNDPMFQGLVVDIDPAGSRHGRVSLLAAFYRPPDPLPRYRFGLQNLSARMPLETLLVLDQVAENAGRSALMQLPGMTEAIADSLLDWMDSDDERRQFGAESEFYLAQDPPRQPPNRVPDRLEDLLAVRGVTRDQLIGLVPSQAEIVTSQFGSSAGGDPGMGGDPAGMEGAGQGLAPMPGSAGGRGAPRVTPWAWYLTTLSAERNVAHDGRPRIALNQEDSRRLRQELSLFFDEGLVNFVIAARRYGISRRPTGEVSDEGVPQDDSSGPAQAAFESPLDLVDAVVTIPDPSGDKNASKSYRSPLRSERTSDGNLLVQFCDRVTTETRSRLRGRVNIMEAERAVLAMLPGWTTEQVDRLMTSRTQQPAGEANRLHASWLLAEQVVDLPAMRRLWPYLTTGGDVFASQIVGVYDEQSPVMRCEVVVDGTRETVPVVRYYDLRRLGRGFASASLRAPESARAASGVEPPGSALLRQASPGARFGDQP